MIAQNLCPPFGGQRPQLIYFSLFPYKRSKESPLDLEIVRKSSWTNGKKKHLFLAKWVLYPSEQGLTGCEPEASVHYDAMLAVIQDFVEHLPHHLGKAAPIC